jgi:hypothetical protein
MSGKPKESRTLQSNGKPERVGQGSMSVMAMFPQLMQNLDELSMHLPTTLLCTLHQFGEARPILDEDQLTML